MTERVRALYTHPTCPNEMGRPKLYLSLTFILLVFTIFLTAKVFASDEVEVEGTFKSNHAGDFQINISREE